MSSSHPAPQSFVAVFVGATRGIGLATLKALTRALPNPRFYIIGRSKARFAGVLALLNEYNPNAAIQFVEAEVSLIKGIDGVCERIMNLEKHVDLLFMSPGSLAFGGPHYNGEKIDLCFALSFYIRMRLIERLLPVLMQAPHPRVLSVLAGGHEGPLFTKDGDIGLRKKACYGSCSGFYRVLSDGNTATDGKVLGPMEREGWPLKVFEHTQEVFGEILSQK
ncbi:Oxidoreductase lepF [Fusarium oxysporum f. sp. raphani]|uniref:Oxidoreductase lepF n=1 Tax=Fusarium oxysporum f. sp. raphani TaxID=96318 RepID=A0A8J5PXI1_FUSOX|nr:Oxidoreductase lepF [Fusarium oxysporum f. sp. raphani]